MSTHKNDPYEPSGGAVLRDDGLLLEGALHNPKWSFHARLSLEQ